MSARQKIKILKGSGEDEFLDLCESIIQKRINERSLVEFVDSDANFTLKLSIENSLTENSFRIAGNEIVGDDKSGLMAGIGKFLRLSSYVNEKFQPFQGELESKPYKRVRGMYYATTGQHTYYTDAPIEDVVEYTEDLALWGTNKILLWHPTGFFKGRDDPAVQEHREMLRLLGRAAKRLGMSVSFGMTSTFMYKGIPEEFKAKKFDPKTLGGHYWVVTDMDACPSVPGGMDYILNEQLELIRFYAEFNPEYISMGMYDPGSCGCEACAPWATNGYLKLAARLAELIKREIPSCKVLACTWAMDRDVDWNEYYNLYPTGALDWTDGFLIPRDVSAYWLKSGKSPGNLPVTGFVEITMNSMTPWVGYGATCNLNNTKYLWAISELGAIGVYCYSEGVHDDILKKYCAALSWGGGAVNQYDFMKEYIAYEFQPNVPDMEKISTAMNILEANHFRQNIGCSSATAFKLLNEVDANLPEKARKKLQWRQLYLRALIDAEMFKIKDLWIDVIQNEPRKFYSDFSGIIHDAPLKVKRKLKAAFDELTDLYHAHDCWSLKTKPFPINLESKTGPREIAGDFLDEEGKKNR